MRVYHVFGFQIWKTPALITEFSPFTLLRTYTGHNDDVLSIEWTPDSQYVLPRFMLFYFFGFSLSRNFTYLFPLLSIFVIHRYFVTSSKDNTVRVYSLHPKERFTPLTLTGHKDAVVACFFSPIDMRVCGLMT